ncbi:MAG: sugar transferase [bacterium]
MNNELTPIALFVYNRPEHTQKTIQALAANILADKSLFYVFSDGPKSESDYAKVNEVRKVVKEASGFAQKIIFESSSNKGLADSVISGVTQVINEHSKVIVMEDDLVSSPSFLSFMNEALSFYGDNKNIFSISGFCYPVQIPHDYKDGVFAIHRPASWGWATWEDRWFKTDWEVKDFPIFKKDKQAQNKFNKCGEDLTPMLFAQMTGRVDSWAVRWAYSHFKNDAYSVFPVKSLINHIGSDSTGTHFKSTSKFEVNIENNVFLPRLVKLTQSNELIEMNIKKFFQLSLIRKAINFVKYFKILN